MPNIMSGSRVRIISDSVLRNHFNSNTPNNFLVRDVDSVGTPYEEAYIVIPGDGARGSVPPPGWGSWLRTDRIELLAVNLRRVLCVECESLIRDSPIYSDDVICPDCGTECERCTTRVPTESTTTVLSRHSDYSEWCDRCADNYSFRCEHCDETCSTSGRASCNDCGNVCRSCSENLSYCDDCDVHYCGEDSHERCSDAGLILIHDYSFKPSPDYRGDGPRYLGLELEISAERYLAGVVREYADDLIYCKHDSSIEDGFEMVSHPMTYEWAAEHYPFGMLDVLINQGARPDESCGMHVHISRAAFESDEHRRRWALLVFRNADAFRAVARRESAEWASFTHSDEDIERIASNGQGGERYRAINAQNRSTFEVRIFASTLSAQELRAALGLVDASCVYAAETSNEEFVNGGWHFDSFVAWLDGRNEYAALSEQIGRQGAYGIGRSKNAPDTRVSRLVSLVPPVSPFDDTEADDAGFALNPTRPHGEACTCGCGLFWDTRLRSEYGTSSEIGWVESDHLTVAVTDSEIDSLLEPVEYMTD